MNIPKIIHKIHVNPILEIKKNKLFSKDEFLKRLMQERLLNSVALGGSLSFILQLEEFYNVKTSYKPNDIDIVAIVDSFNNLKEFPFIKSSLFNDLQTIIKYEPLSLSIKITKNSKLYSIKFLEKLTMEKILSNLKKKQNKLIVIRNTKLDKEYDIFNGPKNTNIKYFYNTIELTNGTQIWFWNPPIYINKLPIRSDILSFFATSLPLSDPEKIYSQFLSRYKREYKKIFYKYENQTDLKNIYSYFLNKLVRIDENQRWK